MPGTKGNKNALGCKTSGSPSKLTATFIKALTKIVKDNALYATDEELVDLVNELLEEKQRISIDIFGKWKRGDSQENNPLRVEFLRLIKKALLSEKKRLLKLIEKDPQAWQRYAWIIERKFNEWNLKQKTEVEHSGQIKTSEVDISKLSDAEREKLIELSIKLRQ